MSAGQDKVSVSVVVPCRNEAEAVVELLGGLGHQHHPLSEILVVDNGSSDGTSKRVAEWLKAHPGAPARLLACERVGQPAALNVGIRAAAGDVIVRIDAHSRPDDDYVNRAIDTLRDTSVGMVGGVWRIVPGTEGAIARSIAVAAAHPIGAGDATYRIGVGAEGRRAVDTVPFGCFYRHTWAELGGFNERVLTNEDYEFAYRIRRRGLAVILDPEMRCTYRARPTLGALATQYFRYGWWKAQMLRWHPQSLRWRQAVPVLFVATLAALAALSLFSEVARLGLGALVALYGVPLIVAAGAEAYSRREVTLLALLPVVFATMHIAWGSGVLVNLMSDGFLPRGFGRLASMEDSPEQAAGVP